MKQTDILDMLTQEQLDIVEDVFYSFIRKSGYEIGNKFNKTERKYLMDQMKKDKVIYERQTKYDYDNKCVYIQFIKKQRKEVLDKSQLIKLVMGGKPIIIEENA